ncbi:MAG: DNA polymerase III subunit delta [Clostridia bacterium]|nr:DNA polymerase III subunit delta [Clostridia bacterium]
MYAKMAANKLITGTQFRQEYKKPKPGVFLFFGEENFLKQKALTDLREKVCADEAFADFNHFVFTRENYTPDSLLTAVMALPMMNDLKLVELYELPFAEFRKKDDMNGLEAALAAACDSEDTLLVIYTTPSDFDPGETKSRSALFKLITKYAVPVEFAHETSQRLGMWVQKHFSAEALIAEPTECAYLMDVVGHDMVTLTNEIDKLCAYLHAKERDKLEKADIDLLCPVNKEIGAFAFADAILDSDNEKAFWILGDKRMKNEPVPVILASITKVYTDLLAMKLCADAGVSSDDAAKRLGMHPYVAKLRMGKARACERAALEAAIDLCAETDAALKSSPLDEYVLLERLIVQASALRRKKVF